MSTQWIERGQKLWIILNRQNLIFKILIFLCEIKKKYNFEGLFKQERCCVGF